MLTNILTALFWGMAGFYIGFLILLALAPFWSEKR